MPKVEKAKIASSMFHSFQYILSSPFAPEPLMFVTSKHDDPDDAGSSESQAPPDLTMECGS